MQAMSLSEVLTSHLHLKQKATSALYKTASIYLAHLPRTLDGFGYIMFPFASPATPKLSKTKLNLAYFCLLIFFWFILKLSAVTLWLFRNHRAAPRVEPRAKPKSQALDRSKSTAQEQLNTPGEGRREPWFEPEDGMVLML